MPPNTLTEYIRTCMTSGWRGGIKWQLLKFSLVEVYIIISEYWVLTQKSKQRLSWCEGRDVTTPINQSIL